MVASIERFISARSGGTILLSLTALPADPHASPKPPEVRLSHFTDRGCRSDLHCPSSCRLQKFLELLFPEFRHAGGGVAARVFTRRYKV